MHRSLYLVGGGYLLICGVVVLRHDARPNLAPRPPVVTTGFGSSAEQWFVVIKPSCNAVEVELAQRGHPAPRSLAGQGYTAPCYALGGKLDSAAAALDRLPPAHRSQPALIAS